MMKIENLKLTKKDDKNNASEEKSFLDQIFDFDLFGSDEEELEEENQRNETFFNKVKKKRKE